MHRFRSQIWQATLFVMMLALSSSCLNAQQIDILLKGGYVVDPKNAIDAQMDVAIKDGNIYQVSKNIAPDQAKQVVNVQGLYVTPGLIDMHVHVFHGTNMDSYLANAPGSLPPDGFTFRSGVTTVVDAGTSGWRNFRQFKRQTIDRAQTRVLAFLSIVGSGMEGRLHAQNVNDMDPVLTAFTIDLFSDIIVGVKKHHYRGPDYTPVEKAVEAGNLANVPVMVDFGEHDPMLSIKTLFLEKLRPGDIFTHTYSYTKGREPVVDENFKVKPFIFEAQRRGIVFDVGMGGGSMIWHQAIPSIQQGFLPDVISTDLHFWSMNDGMKDLANTLSKFLNMGMSIDQIIDRATWKPANVIQRPDLGHLSVGAEADVAVFRVREGDFGFLDSRGRRMSGTRKMEAELTIRAGKIVWDLNGISVPAWDATPRKY
ncbi:MAG: amidohydrolase/deacetylase family metallohydrolase [Saprospiraceae bacterium]|nr:amidohydrolase/deacetylase family metallohydrolase [Saprospiraceae bacterium]